jgi:transposase
MNIHYRVELEMSEREQLEQLIKGGSVSARKAKRAQILLAVDRGHGRSGASEEEIAEILSTSTSTIYRTKRKFVEYGLEEALTEKTWPRGFRKTTAMQDAILITLACTDPPKGCSKWTLRLLAGKWIELSDLGDVSHETVRQRLDEDKLKPWQHKMWCIPKYNSEFLARMEDVLDLYAEPNDPEYPVVCFDESPKQLIGETRVPVPARPGKPRREDYEYKRNGIANMFVFIDRHRCWRQANITKTKTKVDFAEQMRLLVDEYYPEAKKIRVVMDNFSTHKAGSLYDAFSPEEARRILRKLEFHFTPKHASWLNMVEIEIGSLTKQCLDRRIPDLETMRREVDACVKRRNELNSTINWMFSIQDARIKMKKAYQSK